MNGKRLKRLHYWDSCIFFAWIKQETRWPEDVMKGIEQEIEQVYANELTIITSVLTLNEVLQSQMAREQKDQYRKLFGHPRLQLADIDRRIAADAATIREFYDCRVFDSAGKLISGSMMGMADSFHLATAIHYEVTAFETLDGTGRRKHKFDLLPLNGRVADRALTIVAPKYIPPPEPREGPIPAMRDGEQQDLFDAEQDNDNEDEGSDTPPLEV